MKTNGCGWLDVFVWVLLFYAFVFFTSALSYADSGYPYPSVEEEAIEEEVVVTGVLDATRNIDTSLSISAMTATAIEKTAIRSTGEVLRFFSGIRAESSSGESNLNLSIRGVPVASGGAKYVQLFEDGLPVMQFGDIVVGNADAFVKVDNTLARVEALKGGSAVAFASNSPAGIVHFISKTGEQTGGSLQLTTGIDYVTNRSDFEYGKRLNDRWRYHIGGFFRQGKGERETAYTSAQGGQLKFNATYSFAGGYVRTYLKHLDDRSPIYLPMPIAVAGDNKSASIGDIRGFDITHSSNLSSDLLELESIDGRRASIERGYSARSDSLGVELSMNINDYWSYLVKARYAKNRGYFFGAFSAAVFDTSLEEFSPSLLSSAPSLEQAVALGSIEGRVFSEQELMNLNGNGLVQNIRTFDNDLKSLGNTHLDLRLSRHFSQLSLTAGYYHGTQTIDVDWFWQTYIQDLARYPRLLDAYDEAGNPLTQRGLVSYGSPDWGHCCARDTYFDTTIDALYFVMDMELYERWKIDAALRFDRGRASGHYHIAKPNSGLVDGGGNIATDPFERDTPVFAPSSNDDFSYDWQYLSFTAGANYRLSDTLSLYGRVSRGGRANADRLGDGGFFRDGTAVNGAEENELRSIDSGVKFFHDAGRALLAFFYVETDDVNSEGTNGSGDAALLREYTSRGIEFECGYQAYIVDMQASITWTDAEIAGSNSESIIGNTPRRQADWVYTLSSSVEWQRSRLGLSLVGTTDAPAQDSNDFIMPGYSYVNFFSSYDLSQNIRLSAAINNVTDEAGLTESEEGDISGLSYIRARSITGRSSSLSVKYTF